MIKDTADTDTMVTMAGNSVLQELDDREGRRDNIVIYRLKEPSSDISTGQERKKFDTKTLLDVFKTIDVDINEEHDIKFITRTGEVKDDIHERPRPLLIGLKDNNKKQIILNSARKLANSKYKHISIVPDLTKKQRENDNKLRKEAEDKNNELDEDEALNYEWKVIGIRGQRRLIKAKKNQTDNQNQRKRTREATGGDSPPSQRQNTMDC